MKFDVRAYGDYEMGLKTQDVVIIANSRDEAYDKAWSMFPEYHEIGVYEINN